LLAAAEVVTEKGRGAERERWWSSPAWLGTIAGVVSAVLAAVALFATNDSGAPAPTTPSAPAEEGATYFMYGTMKPGHLRYPEIDDFVASTTRDRVAGRLFDTGAGYPAAKFAPGDAEVEGYVLRIRPDRAAEATETIAELEGNLFRPVTVKTRGGTTAVAYEYIGSTEGMEELPDGVWDREEADG
jgi:gamma-glutamylcyclotransferase (GGCT)/AIG2-like uncharacterized protein YtfP